ncbi:MAG: glycosyltransferase family 39 protein [Candidatus Bathyarchaeia archaeon]
MSSIIEELRKNLRSIECELLSNKLLRATLLGYIIAVLVLYALPTVNEPSEWYSFYSYLSAHKAAPYVDVREGYPPLGFLIYYPLYYLFQSDAAAFSFCFRAFNALLLALTFFVLYLTLKSMFREKQSLKFALYYAVLPSVVIANAYSNDIVALFPSALAIYMMIKKKVLLCGVLIAIATLGKGFPLLLIIPALIAFASREDKLKLVGATFGLLILASLPFLILNPLTFLSTFTHVGSRGPWETVWAVMDGYYSHGGFLHPFFDKFFIHSNLLKIYSPSPYDHAVYAWNFEILPTLLTLFQIVAILLFSLVYIKRKNDVIKLCGLFYIAYLMFFKGYSTQFAVSTSFYALLAAIDNPLPILLPLEASHIMQILSWKIPDLFRDWHLPLLLSSIFLRTAVFLWLLLHNLMSVRLNLKRNIRLFIGDLLGYLNLFRDVKAVALVLTIFLMLAPNVNLLNNQIKSYASLKIYEGDINLSTFNWKNLTIGELERGDQIAVKLNTTVWVCASIYPNDLLVPIERGIRNQYHLKDSFNETILFFKAESDFYNLMLQLAHPAMPFRVTNGLDGDLKINVTSNNSTLTFDLQDKGKDGKNSTFRMAYPVDFVVDDSFRLVLEYYAADDVNVLLEVFDDPDEWIYVFNTTNYFVLKPDSTDLPYCSNLYGDKISLLALTITVKDGSNSTFELKKLSVTSGNKTHDVNFYAQNSIQVSYAVFIERDWKPPEFYTATLIVSVALFFVLLCHLHKKIKALGN